MPAPPCGGTRASCPLTTTETANFGQVATSVNSLLCTGNVVKTKSTNYRASTWTPPSFAISQSAAFSRNCCRRRRRFAQNHKFHHILKFCNGLCSRTTRSPAATIAHTTTEPTPPDPHDHGRTWQPLGPRQNQQHTTLQRQSPTAPPPTSSENSQNGKPPSNSALCKDTSILTTDSEPTPQSALH